MTNSHYLVTGASGFLGGALARRLAASGLRTRVLVRNSEQAALFNHPGIETAIGHLEDIDSLRKAVAGVSVILHCAATSTDWAPWVVYESGNVIGVNNLLNVAVQVSSLQRFVHISSTDVYGYPVDPHQPNLTLKEVDIPYNQTKVRGEQAVWQASAAYGLPVTILRPATIYGPGSKDFVVNFADLLKLRLMLLIDGGQAAAGLLYIDNAVDAIIAAALAPNTIGQAYDLRDESAETWRDYLYALAEALGLPPPWLNLPFSAAYAFAAGMERVHSSLRLPGKPLLTRHAVYLMSRAADFPITPACRDFGFASKVQFPSAIERSVTWLQRTKQKR